MDIQNSHIFNFYKDKALNVLNHRAQFVTIYVTSIIVFLAPILSGISVKDGQTLCNGNVPVLIAALTIILFLAWGFWELKYREYRWNYIKIATRTICNNEIFPKINEENNLTKGDVCDFIHNKTLFPKNYIMKIITDEMTDLFDEHSDKNVKNADKLNVNP
ncbi:hypothetical protein [Methanogenium sp. MK-MG]|uniref:hypothetical protein n=1 Tax=Methanogenium sp. MK-MG TaxID=2599926 RepID=UPI0013EBDBB1|nr:hypothetical protein [Methanogenium sp. MK-MG]KAF1073559.1 hypothetical protein MKMG_02127 [Methanogenium sp. MK-MG]